MKKFLFAAFMTLSQGVQAKVLVVPTGANVQGLFGSYFKTKLTILAPGDPQAQMFFQVTLQVLPPSGTGGVTRNITVQQGWLTVFENVFDTLGYVGGGGLQILYPDNQAILVSAEVYVDGPSGRYSTAVPVVDPSAPNAVVSTTIGVSNDALNRTNIGCSGLLNPTPVTAEVHRTDGSLLGTMNFFVPAYGWTQVAVPFNVTDGYIRWGGGGYIYCYAVNVNNQSNDGTLIR